MRLFAAGTHYSFESTEAMQITCLAQGHIILMWPRIEQLISVSRNCVLTLTWLQTVAEQRRKVGLKVDDANNRSC